MKSGLIGSRALKNRSPTPHRAQSMTRPSLRFLTDGMILGWRGLTGEKHVPRPTQ